MYRLSCHDARSKNLQATLREQAPKEPTSSRTR
eukprot:NP_001294065.1 Uncharacterized protein CELE_C01F6.9 [Caenorhabditis elegans]